MDVICSLTLPLFIVGRKLATELSFPRSSETKDHKSFLCFKVNRRRLREKTLFQYLKFALASREITAHSLWCEEMCVWLWQGHHFLCRFNNRIKLPSQRLCCISWEFGYLLLC